MSHALLAELRALLAKLDADARTRAIVLTGSGRAFSSGADLSGGPSDAEAVIRTFYNPLILAMTSMRTLYALTAIEHATRRVQRSTAPTRGHYLPTVRAKCAG